MQLLKRYSWLLIKWLIGLARGREKNNDRNTNWRRIYNYYRGIDNYGGGHDNRMQCGSNKHKTCKYCGKTKINFENKLCLRCMEVIPKWLRGVKNETEEE